MTGRRHRSNCELVAQGFANIGSALFGGICVTGTIARTATNVRAGARSPISGMLHSVFLLLFMLIAAPLASYIPLAALASVLVVVAWNMAEKHEFATLIRSSRGDAIVLLATFLLTIFRDLTEGILVGFALGAVLFINRMAEMTGIEAGTPLVTADRADDGNGDRVPYDSRLAADPDVLVYRITGAFFFGAASAVGTVLDSIADRRKAFVVDFAAVPFLDSTAANAMSRVAAKAKRQGIRLFITGASPTVRRALLTHGVRPPRARYRETIARAVADIKGSARNCRRRRTVSPQVSSPRRRFSRGPLPKSSRFREHCARRCAACNFQLPASRFAGSTMDKIALVVENETAYRLAGRALPAGQSRSPAVPRLSLRPMLRHHRSRSAGAVCVRQSEPRLSLRNGSGNGIPTASRV